MATVLDIAFEHIAAKQDELYGKALVGESSLLAQQPSEGGKLGGLVGHYVDVYNAMADYCVQQYRWANENSPPGIIRDSHRWHERMRKHIDHTHHLARGRVEYMSKPFGVKDEFYIGVMLDFIDRFCETACDRLRRDLKTAEAEFRNADRKERHDLRQKIWLAIFGVVVGSLGTIVVGHFTSQQSDTHQQSTSASPNPSRK